MKFVSFNIQYGFGADGRYDLARAAQAVDGADIIALQEVERFWERSGRDDQPDILARMMPDHHWVYGPAFDMDASFGRLLFHEGSGGAAGRCIASRLGMCSQPIPSRPGRTT